MLHQIDFNRSLNFMDVAFKRVLRGMKNPGSMYIYILQLLILRCADVVKSVTPDQFVRKSLIA